MKYLVIFPSLLTTGSAATLTTVNFSNNNHLHVDMKNHHVTEQSNLTNKHISELANINKLKNQQKIEELTIEVIPNVSIAKTRFDEYYSTSIHVIDEKSNITTFSNSNVHKQTTLQTLLAEQVKLSQKHAIYTEIKDHFDSNFPVKTNWEMVTDSSGSNKCKIQKKTSGVTPVLTPPATPDVCSYDWNILSIDLTDKISTLLTDNPSSTALLNKFNNIPNK